jgi:hypothetical protein
VDLIATGRWGWIWRGSRMCRCRWSSSIARTSWRDTR